MTLLLGLASKFPLVSYGFNLCVFCWRGIIALEFVWSLVSKSLYTSCNTGFVATRASTPFLTICLKEGKTTVIYFLKDFIVFIYFEG